MVGTGWFVITITEALTAEAPKRQVAISVRNCMVMDFVDGCCSGVSERGVTGITCRCTVEMQGYRAKLWDQLAYMYPRVCGCCLST